MRAGIFAAGVPEEEALATVQSEPSMDGSDLASVVSPDELIELPGTGPHIVGIDTGVKLSIIREFRERDCRLTLVPCATGPESVMKLDPDLVFLANGPGDPAALGYLVETVRALIGQVPIVGICLGHQLLCRALGLKTFKLRFGHRGANHPVKDLRTGRIEITAQNHGFAVNGPGGEEELAADKAVSWETQHGTAELSHLNLYDRTVEGVTLEKAHLASVQYHPEAGPGPHDARHLFDRFVDMAA
jgi:carbamoyl-phosphate synthase small subunit